MKRGRDETFPSPVAKVLYENVAESGKVDGLCRPCRSAILVGYEKHAQKETAPVRGLPGAAIETPRGIAAGEANRPPGGGRAQGGAQTFGETRGGRGFNRDHSTGNRATCQAEKLKVCKGLP